MKLLTCSTSFCLAISLSVAICANDPIETGPVASNTEAGNTEASEKTAPVVPHCEVPCGVYADQRRFEEMLEDCETISKSIKSLNEYIAGMQSGPPTATVLNQSVRWVNTKESHATNTQHIVAQYFLTQRIKPDNKEYVKQLVSAHRVMVAAMKCKQDSHPATADTLKKAILDLYRAYEGREPEFDKHNKKDAMQPIN